MALIVAGCQATASETAAGPASPQAQRVIDQYLAEVRGRYGALAITADGGRAAYHICRYRSSTTCDDVDPFFNSSFTQSYRIAAKHALSSCGGGCRVLYINDKRKD
jgi:hypothetical protein